MGFVRLAPVLVALLAVGCCKNKPDAAAIDRDLSTFARRIHTQLENATDPYHPSERDAETLARSMSNLRERRDILRAELAGSDETNDQTRQRIQLIRIERQIEMIDRLMTRFEQNAPAVATGN